jgi:hypothetical protein
MKIKKLLKDYEALFGTSSTSVTIYKDGSGHVNSMGNVVFRFNNLNELKIIVERESLSLTKP